MVAASSGPRPSRIAAVLVPVGPKTLWFPCLRRKGGSSSSSQVATAAGSDAVDHGWRVHLLLPVVFKMAVHLLVFFFSIP